jgi:NAD(P)-dependent dehydrogenase (short-subunit alcohol dehydrogenase family)
MSSSARSATQPPIPASTRFSGQVILVTGAAGGLGSAASQRLTDEGANVVNTDSLGTGDGTKPDASLPLDVTDRTAWDRTIAETLHRHDRIDGALFAHGIQGPESDIHEMPFREWSRTFSVNLDGCFHGLSALLPMLRSAGYGRVAILSSIAAREGNPQMAAYSASKAAVVALVKTAAKEAALDGVTVNAIAPSMFRTRLLDDLSPERNAQLLARVPMGRIGEPHEFAALAAWLLSREASYTTGQVLDLSGGRNTA